MPCEHVEMHVSHTQTAVSENFRDLFKKSSLTQKPRVFSFREPVQPKSNSESVTAAADSAKLNCSRAGFIPVTCKIFKIKTDAASISPLRSKHKLMTEILFAGWMFSEIPPSSFLLTQTGSFVKRPCSWVKATEISLSPAEMALVMPYQSEWQLDFCRHLQFSSCFM